jgi:hypothetical protein
MEKDRTVSEIANQLENKLISLDTKLSELLERLHKISKDLEELNKLNQTKDKTADQR